MSEITLVDQAADAHVALSPLRRQILGRLTEPASAAELAAQLGLPRQKVNYHMSVLERHALIELAEVRQRRGFKERRMVRRGAVVLAPDLLEDGELARDDMSAEAVVAAASDAIRAVGALAGSGSPHPTATLSTDMTFATPADLRRFLDGVATLAARFDAGAEAAGARMRVTLLAHQQPKETRS